MPKLLLHRVSCIVRVGENKSKKDPPNFFNIISKVLTPKTRVRFATQRRRACSCCCCCCCCGRWLERSFEIFLAKKKKNCATTAADETVITAKVEEVLLFLLVPDFAKTFLHFNKILLFLPPFCAAHSVERCQAKGKQRFCFRMEKKWRFLFMIVNEKNSYCFLK